MNDHRSKRTGPVRQRSAFTLIELLVVISIIAVILTPIVPALESARRLARQAEMTSMLRDAAMVMEVYRIASQDDTYPSEQELGESGRLNPTHFVWDADAMQILFRDCDYRLVIVSADQNGFVLCADPVDPYRHGSSRICIDETGQMVDAPPDEEAEAVEEERHREATLRALEGTARTILMSDDPEDAAFVLPYLEFIDPQETLSYALDLNQNGVISQTELHEYMGPHPRDSPAEAEARATFRDVFSILHLEGDYEVKVADLQGDPTALFDAPNIALAIEASVPQRGVAHACELQVFAAEDARREGDLDACARRINAARNLIRAQEDKFILPGRAPALDALMIILAPEEPL